MMKFNIEFTENELNALTRVLTFVKFDCEDSEARYLAGSPFVADLYQKASDAICPYYTEKSIPFPKEFPGIESIKHYLKVIGVHIQNTSDWDSLSLETKDSFVRTLISPFKVEDQTIEELISEGDTFHSSKKSTVG